MGPARTRVKICGLCSAADAQAAVAAGADAVGVVLGGTGPRRLTLEEAAAVLDAVPPFVTRVGVFVDPTVADVVAAVRALRLGAVQLHGAETPERCAEVAEASPAAVIKAFRVGEGFGPAEIGPYVPHVAAVLLDTLVPGADGGTGTAFCWDAGLAPAGVPVIVAGGLTPDNVVDAIRAMRPFAVDTSSGVERSPRQKDHVRVTAFVAAVRGHHDQGETDR